MLNPVVFRELDSQRGPHTVDRFADWCYSQTPHFNSCYYCPGAKAIDAFTCDWGCDNNRWCPPLYLIPCILGHAKLTKAKGALIIPKWVSAPFWPLLFLMGFTRQALSRMFVNCQGWSHLADLVPAYLRVYPILLSFLCVWIFILSIRKSN